MDKIAKVMIVTAKLKILVDGQNKNKMLLNFSIYTVQMSSYKTNQSTRKSLVLSLDKDDTDY